ncbi:hypothetical protein CPJCM30710_33820 [Clostridium polyendosporum]|uniref:ABC-type glycerol-3-phosphate transport system, substrate-binding protein n=1 Tax=Clostridium polyendosporum TaxID=69208 RepID=A0A919S3J9_9CLOT|nr:ABC transporter substrate-binding protein [Clostridium polyendosporum]GIM30716.1 hypothetical protein CPJCM30710_33820 [Clostridium polyendosporum]
MKYLFKACSLVIVLILFFSMISCSRDKKSPQKGSLNILIENNTTSDMEGVNSLISLYQKEHSSIDIKVKNINSFDKIKKEIANKKEHDILICNRSVMIELAREGLIGDITNNLTTNKATEKFNNIVLSYGRIDNKYYGLGIIPYSIQFIYNKNEVGKYGINTELEDVGDVGDVAKLLKDRNIKIPVVLPKEIDLSLALSTIVANNVIDEMELEKNFDVGKLKYKQITSMQDVFKLLNIINKEYGMTKDTLYKADDKIVKKVEEGEIPFAFVTSLAGKELEDSKNIKILNGRVLPTSKINPPIIVEHLVCSIQNAPDKEEINRFLDFITKDEPYEKLGKEGIMTGNKQGNTFLKGFSQEMLWPLSIANENNIAYYYNLPSEMQPFLLDEVNKVFDGLYSGNEWNTVVENTYK